MSNGTVTHEIERALGDRHPQMLRRRRHVGDGTDGGVVHGPWARLRRSSVGRRRWLAHELELGRGRIRFIRIRTWNIEVRGEPEQAEEEVGAAAEREVRVDERENQQAPQRGPRAPPRPLRCRRHALVRDLIGYAESAAQEPQEGEHQRDPADPEQPEIAALEVDDRRARSRARGATVSGRMPSTHRKPREARDVEVGEVVDATLPALRKNCRRCSRSPRGGWRPPATRSTAPTTLHGSEPLHELAHLALGPRDDEHDDDQLEPRRELTGAEDAEEDEPAHRRDERQRLPAREESRRSRPRGCTRGSRRPRSTS